MLSFAHDVLCLVAKALEASQILNSALRCSLDVTLKVLHDLRESLASLLHTCIELLDALSMRSCLSLPLLFLCSALGRRRPSFAQDSRAE